MNKYSQLKNEALAAEINECWSSACDIWEEVAGMALPATAIQEACEHRALCLRLQWGLASVGEERVGRESLTGTTGD